MQHFTMTLENVRQSPPAEKLPRTVQVSEDTVLIDSALCFSTWTGLGSSAGGIPF